MDVENRLLVAETLARYGHVVDAGQLDRLDTVLTTDVVYDMSAVGLPVMEGLDALRTGALRLGAHNPLAHHVTDVVITGATDAEAFVDSKGFMLTVEGTVRSVTHHDVVRRTADGWRIASRRIVPQTVPLGGLLGAGTGQRQEPPHE